MTKRQVPGLDLWSFWAEGADFKAEMDPNLQTLSVLVHGSAKSRTAVLPGSGLEGDIYIVRDDAVSNANEIAFWDGPSGGLVWNYITPKEGWQFWAEDEDKLYVYDGSAWIEFEQGSGGGGSAGPSDTGYVARNARFWALLDLESGGTEVSAVQMEIRGSVGGSELVVTPSASSEDGSNVALNAYDDDGATYWRSSGDNGQARFIYDAGLNGGDPLDPIQVNVAEIAITARGGGDEAEAPTRLILAYADEDGVWAPVTRIVTGAWSADETKTFDVSAFTKRVEIAADDLRLDSTVALTSGAYESTGLDLSDKDGLQVFFDRIDVDTSDEHLDFTLFVGGVEIVTGYEFRTRVTSHNTGGDENYQAQSAGTAVQITGDGSTWGTNAATSEISGMIEVYGIKDGDWKLGKAVVVHKAATGTTVTAETYFRLRSAGAITGWKIAPSAGNVESGDVYERLIEASAFGAAEGGGGGATTFVELTDTPAGYGTAGQLLATNSGEDGAEWINPPSGLPALSTAGQVLAVNGAADDVEWTDVPEELPTLGTAGQVLKVNSAEDGVEWADETGGDSESDDPVIFHVTKTATQAITSGADRDITFESVVTDTDSGWDGVNDEWVVPAALAGRYMVFAVGLFSNSFVEEDWDLFVSSDLKGNIGRSKFELTSHAQVITPPILLVAGEKFKVGIFSGTNATVGVRDTTFFSGLTVDGGAGAGNSAPSFTRREITGTAYTMNNADFAGQVHLTYNSTSNCTVTLPTGLDPVAPVTLEQENTGRLIFVAAASATVNGLGAADRTAGPHAVATLIPKGSDTFTLAGAVEAA